MVDREALGDRALEAYGADAPLVLQDRCIVLGGDAIGGLGAAGVAGR